MKITLAEELLQRHSELKASGLELDLPRVLGGQENYRGDDEEFNYNANEVADA